MPGGSSWKEFNTEWRDKDPARRLFQRLGRPDWQIARRWLRHAAWPFAVAIAFGLISLWLYQAVQTLPDFSIFRFSAASEPMRWRSPAASR